ncbi:probable tRNA (uracil-O(2)-)-methyltransferase [Asterias amurensis]|uniref:probable tRNA (uracil-O(2)-)-methyltransferase n=1 Tax=Asterias amurensis TaxID=7602 RepID=UPI003AB80F95
MESTKWLELKEIKASCEEKTFLKAVEIWLQKPQVVNRRLAGAVFLQRQRVLNACSLQQSIIELVSKSEGSEDSIEFLPKVIQKDCSNVLSGGSLCLSELEETKQEERGIGEEIGPDENHDGVSRFELCLRKLVPRQLGQGSTTVALKEIIIIDHEDCSATFVALLNNTSDTERREIHDHSPSTVSCCGSYVFNTAYKISFSSKTQRISLHVSVEYHEPQSTSQAITCPTKAWLQDCLLPKIVKWASEVSPDTVVRSSQTLVAVERYSSLYAELKKKYGIKFVKIWPETTDPLKFVYEDVAIATYLLVLWEQEREEKNLKSLQSFVDLGCGNGLLVHILNSEGHPGKGIDLRRRKIWDLYGPGTNLEECSITPSDEFLFADYDWLIGNHSDELTPWIPVMAARSCYTTRYFVLPCCFHDFDAKFIRSEQSKTQYRAYLDFVQEVGKVSGFRVQEDILRIPSTKRICQIGSQRNYQREQTEEVSTRIKNFISRRRQCRKQSAQKKDTERTHKQLTVSGAENCTDHSDDATRLLESKASSDRDTFNHPSGPAFHHSSDDSSNTTSARWAPEFQPREKIEPVRNCANVDSDLKKRITCEVAHAILGEGGEDASDVLRGAKDMKVWRRGGSLTLPEIAKLFNSDVLKQLKKECGGLKTLLKNSHQVFQVVGDKVVIRDWSTSNQDNKPTLSKKRKYKASDKMHFFKTSLCWFNAHHPDGCPLLANDCQFAHGEGELKNPSLPSR